ncbi:MAG: septal ring lytic transglycosylase RlpA family protein [Halieaceae bacterium]|jgi:rare lipoprotein A|nr:septal ring lytic transglycosylase RlpA family protein [Halieaceae bacterium]
MIPRGSLYAFASVQLLLLITACSGIYRGGDGAPLRTIAASEVRDAIPRADPIKGAGNQSPYTVRGVRYQVLKNALGYKERGIASWYGVKFQGKQTSNGEKFDLYGSTAAHKTLPIPSYVRVTNQHNGRSIVVRVNDRGPFHADRLIDLSYAAAVKLGFVEKGTAMVEVEHISVTGVEDLRHIDIGGYRYIQVGAFAAAAVAEQLQTELAQLIGAPVFISPVQYGSKLMYRVRIGPFTSQDELAAAQRQLKRTEYGPGQPLP